MLYSDGASSYIIHRFMTYNLGLRGAELNVYALIYSFSLHGEKAYVGSKEYIANSAGIVPKTAERCLKSLSNKKLIIRRARKGLRASYSYEINFEIIEDFFNTDLQKRTASN